MDSSLGGEEYASSEMIDHVALSREFYAPFVDLLPGMVSVAERESLFTHIKTKRAVPAKHLARRFRDKKQGLGNGEQDNAY